MPRNPRKASCWQDDERYLEMGCQLLKEQAVKQSRINYLQACRDVFTNTGITISYDKLRRRYLGQSRPSRKAHESQQLLSQAQEKILIEWVIYRSDTAHPINKHTLRRMAQDVCGKMPCERWVEAFLKRNPEVRLGKPSGLDPSRAWAFNKPVVSRHFELLAAIITKDDVPVENIYNMDEKGCQLGGGRKANMHKYLVPRNRRPRYKKRSGNLDLITIIECVGADGDSLRPGFVFSGKEFSAEWFDTQGIQ